MGTQEWEEFKKLMGIGEAEKKKIEEKQAKEKKAVQKNTLANYFGKSAKA